MGMTSWWLLDLALAGLILVLGAISVCSRDPQRAVVMFIAFGLALALAWVRLAAPDLALAEAAIGSGLTGVLLLQAIKQGARADSTENGKREQGAEGADARSEDHTGEHTRGPGWYWLSAVLILMFAGMLLYAIHTSLNQGIPAPVDAAVTLAEQAQQSLSSSGVSNPVTAVLLNYRLYDTLLELAVLLAAVLGVLALGNLASGNMAPGKSGVGAEPEAMTQAPGPLLALLRWLVPVIILTSGYLLWAGAHAPGGAFQAGAMLAGAFALVYLCGLVAPGPISSKAWRASLVVAVAAFLVSALISVLLGLPMLTIPSAFAGMQILLMEIAATLSVAATLAVAVAGGLAWSERDASQARQGGGQ